MAKPKFKTVRGIKFAHDVDTSGIDWESPPTPELVAALKRKPKVRITTMVDEDIIDALKRLAAESEEDLGYQTVLNLLLRAVLFPQKAKAKKKASRKKAS